MQSRSSLSESTGRQASLDLTWATQVALQATKTQRKPSNAQLEPLESDQVSSHPSQDQLTEMVAISGAIANDPQLAERRSSSESSQTPGQSGHSQITSGATSDQCSGQITPAKPASTSIVSGRSGRPQALRRQSDSQGSDLSEGLENSLSLSSPDYMRSPRQSEDSDILGLR